MIPDERGGKELVILLILKTWVSLKVKIFL